MTGPDWRTLLAQHDGIEMQQPASPSDLARAETSLDAVLPAELRALYLVSDGVYDKLGQWFAIWPLADLIGRNRNAWSWEDAGRRELVGFGDGGTGDPFCVPRDGSSGVLLWSPIAQDSRLLADTITEFWTTWTMN